VAVTGALLVRGLDFSVLGKILAELGSAVVFVLIVVFQPELRRGLLSLGEHRILHSFAPRSLGCEEQISAAVESLVRERHGALFCIERFNSLHHIAKTGVPVDADARAELLASIFWPGNPLHDGGVIIRGNRLIAAACILPVTERRDLATRLGTRHRAALGLAEESDAVIVVVSEETGNVSVAADGQLRQLDDPKTLPDEIRRLTGTTAAPAVAPPAAPDDPEQGFSSVPGVSPPVTEPPPTEDTPEDDTPEADEPEQDR
jgi:diadenylate cyclase